MLFDRDMSEKHYDKNKVERVHKFLADNLSVRVASVIATDVVAEMQRVSQSTPIPTMAVGRSMIGALLLAANHLKESSQQVGVYFQGNGPLKKIFAEANYAGDVRGYSPGYNLGPEDENQELWTVGKAMGIGLLSVTKHVPNGPPHKGVVQIISGEIGDDIAYYLHQSFQIRSVVSLGVHLDSMGQVEAAGGVLLEIMPGASEKIIDQIEENVKGADNVTEMILKGCQSEDLVKSFLKGMSYTQLDHNYPIHYTCKCSEEKVEGVLELLGLKELDDILAKQEEVSVSCDFCGRPFLFSLERVQEIRNKLYKETLN